MRKRFYMVSANEVQQTQQSLNKSETTKPFLLQQGATDHKLHKSHSDLALSAAQHTDHFELEGCAG